MQAFKQLSVDPLRFVRLLQDQLLTVRSIRTLPSLANLRSSGESDLPVASGHTSLTFGAHQQVELCIGTPFPARIN